MTINNIEDIISPDKFNDFLPEDVSDSFFDALYGDADEGAYDISLKFKEFSENKLTFEFHLSQRPGKCLACNLTYGLPEVFSRHPVINIKGLISKINELMNGKTKCTDWKIGSTREISKELHIIPLIVTLES
ncbi:MAG: pancreas/duodenum homeobox protein 1 [Desulfobacterales bacterium]|jgi:hypothetical protein|nr:pancreas/duodenum homeobox protein 1 [Desulfobacteraceae bacterium]MBT4365751.1 pancreas/duodenum homeobox protein 1 [Desulfobacteraceae bacterium]MBT7086560.1 pancreas/duodenum homeobox protein 1 [Desulfobacterales bacterium]MBT7696735.1 pancreas/duodenum homeobox protein 1 [Desulfobacterales bacterium]